MEEGIVHAAFVDVQDPCGPGGPLSPETSEFVNLERQLIMDEPNFIIGQQGQSPVPNIPIGNVQLFFTFMIILHTRWRFITMSAVCLHSNNQ